MSTVNRTHVTDVFAVPVRNAELVHVASPPVRTQPPPVREVFVRPMPESGCECDVDLDDPVRAHLQTLINKKYQHLCVCSPNRSDMLAADAEMKAHPGYAEYKARRDAAMGHHGG